MIRVLLVDDHAVVREGYRRLLERDQRIQVVGEAADAAQACKLAASIEPTVVVMDIALPGGSGLEAMRRMLVHKPRLRVLIFSMHGEAIFVSRAMQAGARGYITKSRCRRRRAEIRSPARVRHRHAYDSRIRSASATRTRRVGQGHRRKTRPVGEDRGEPPVCHSREARGEKRRTACPAGRGTGARPVIGRSGMARHREHGRY